MHNYSIEQIVPHAHPMILIDRLIEYTETTACCSVAIQPNVNFYNSVRGAVPSYVGLEYLAQTIAAYANAHKRDQGQDTALGFLVSTRTFTAHVSEFHNGSELIMTVSKLFKEENGLGAFDCVIKQNNDVLVEAKINVYEPEDPHLYLKEQA